MAKPPPIEAFLNSSLDRLHAALASAPDLTKELGALQTAQQAFDDIRQKAAEAHSTDYAAMINNARANVVTAQARFEIGRATDQDLAEAKAGYAAAKEKAEFAQGRRAVFHDELEHARGAIQDAIDALDDAKLEWSEKVTTAAREAENLALRLLVTASHALHLTDSERPQVYAMQILSALPQYTDLFAGGGATSIRSEATEPDQIYSSNVTRRRASRSLDYVPDSDRMSASRAENREVQLSPQSIEQAREYAFQSTERARSTSLLNTNQPPPHGHRKAP